MQYKEIVEKQKDIAENIHDNLEDLKNNIKTKKVDEVLYNLSNLKDIVDKDQKEMMSMLDKDLEYKEEFERENVEIISSLDESCEEIDEYCPNIKTLLLDFSNMVTCIQKLPKNNFKKSAESEMERIINKAYCIINNRQGVLCSNFNEHDE